MAILTSADYPEVRAAISLSLDETTVPDAVIEMGIFQGAAEAELLRRVPGAEDLTDEALIAHVRNAAIYLTASILAPSIPQLISGSTKDIQYRLAQVDWDKRAAVLRAQADEAITGAVGATPASQRPVFFTVACGRRGA